MRVHIFNMDGWLGVYNPTYDPTTTQILITTPSQSQPYHLRVPQTLEQFVLVVFSVVVLQVHV